MLQHEDVIKAALDAGFDLCGLTPAKHLAKGEERFRAWLDEEHHASLGYLTRYIEKRFDPRLLVEGARTLIVCAAAYKSPISEGYPADFRTKIASYACNRDYHLTIKEQLWALLKRLQEQHPDLRGRAFVDSAPVAEKSLAVEAGLGWIGRNSLLITPQYGSYIHLGVLVLNEEADQYDHPYTTDGCGNCRRCIDACPTRAILEPDRLIDAGRCIACQTIEQQPDQAVELDGWIFGCDSCQQPCPYNRRAPYSRNPAFTPRFDPRTWDIERWQNLSEEDFRADLGDTPLTRSGLQRIRSQINR